MMLRKYYLLIFYVGSKCKKIIFGGFRKLLTFCHLLLKTQNTLFFNKYLILLPFISYVANVARLV